jgi:hypothetical protein
VWIVSAVFTTTRESIERMYANPRDETILMDREALALVTGPGCWHCDQEYSTAVANSPCPGEPSSKS